MPDNRSTNSLTKYVVIAASGMILVAGAQYPYNSYEPVGIAMYGDCLANNYLYSAKLSGELNYKYYENSDDICIAPKKIMKIAVTVNTKITHPVLYIGD